MNTQKFTDNSHAMMAAARDRAAAEDNQIVTEVHLAIAFVTDLPQTASQKLARGKVKQLAAERIEAGQVFDLRSSKQRRRQHE